MDLTKAKFTWTFFQGTGGAVASFHVKCGAATGLYTITKAITDPTLRTLPVNQVVTAVGTYFCAITAANQYGESAPSAEVNFTAGASPVAPSGFTVQ